jgi:hypothetical protein
MIENRLISSADTPNSSNAASVTSFSRYRFPYAVFVLVRQEKIPLRSQAPDSRLIEMLRFDPNYTKMEA